MEILPQCLPCETPEVVHQKQNDNVRKKNDKAKTK